VTFSAAVGPLFRKVVLKTIGVRMTIALSVVVFSTVPPAEADTFAMSVIVPSFVGAVMFTLNVGRAPEVDAGLDGSGSPPVVSDPVM
jgi:hypothetical protein